METPSNSDINILGFKLGQIPNLIKKDRGLNGNYPRKQKTCASMRMIQENPTHMGIWGF